MSAKRKDLYKCSKCNGETIITQVIKKGDAVVRRHYCQKCDLTHVVAYAHGKTILVEAYKPKKHVKWEEIL